MFSEENRVKNGTFPFYSLGICGATGSGRWRCSRAQDGLHGGFISISGRGGRREKTHKMFESRSEISAWGGGTSKGVMGSVGWLHLEQEVPEWAHRKEMEKRV